MTYKQIRVLAFLLLATVSYVHAQGNTGGSGSITYGGYNWEADQATTTTLFLYTLNISTIPNPNPAQIIRVNIHNSTIVHEVHGNISLAVWHSGSCGNCLVIVCLRDQNWAVICGVKLDPC